MIVDTVQQDYILVALLPIVTPQQKSLDLASCIVLNRFDHTANIASKGYTVDMRDIADTEKKLGLGRPRAYTDPAELYEKCIEYLQWVQDNPMVEQKVFHHSGEITKNDSKPYAGTNYTRVVPVFRY